MLWWKQLSAVDKANVENVDSFVTSCEDLFGRERDSWTGTSMGIARLHQEAEAESDGGGEG